MEGEFNVGTHGPPEGWHLWIAISRHAEGLLLVMGCSDKKKNGNLGNKSKSRFHKSENPSGPFLLFERRQEKKSVCAWFIRAWASNLDYISESPRWISMQVYLNSETKSCQIVISSPWKFLWTCQIPLDLQWIGVHYDWWWVGQGEGMILVFLKIPHSLCLGIPQGGKVRKAEGRWDK